MSALRSPDADPPRPTLRERGASLTAAAARVLRKPQASEPGPAPAPADDPAVAAISAHRAAYAAWLPHLDATSEAKGGSPEWHATHAAAEEPMRVETEAYGDLIATPPTTLAGLRALAAYLPAMVGAAGITDDDNDALIALGTVSRAVLALVDSGAPLAAPSPVGWNDPPPGFMASPAIEPFSFARIPSGLRIELERLHDIARAEFQRRTEGLRDHMGEDEARAREAEIRADLFLSPLTAAIDPDSAGALALAALDGPESPDPALAAIAASLRAEAEMKAFGDDPRAASRPGWFDREQALSDAQVRTRLAAWDTVPTSRAGRLALVEYARFQRDALCTPAAEYASVLNLLDEILNAFTASVRAEQGVPSSAKVATSAHDLSALTLGDLAHLHATASTLWTTTSMFLNAPFAWDAARENYGLLGDIIEVEVNRWEALATLAAKEAGRRSPRDREERDRRLEIAAQHAMLGGGPIDDPSLVAEIARTWGA